MPKLQKTNSWLMSSGFDEWSLTEHNDTKIKKSSSNKKNGIKTQLTPEKKLLKHERSQSDPWIDKYKPSSQSELAIHPKKIEELKSWLTHAKHSNKGKAPILLVTGGSGVGKSTALEVVAKSIGFEIQEWVNPLTIGYDTIKSSGLKYLSQVDEFKDFLFRCGRYPMLQFKNDQLYKENNNTNHFKLLVIEDFPNFLLREPLIFRDILKQYRHTQLYPLALIISSGSSTDNIKRQLLPTDILQALRIQTINFNAISNTLMSKALKQIAHYENKEVTKDELSAILAASSGDIRAAINSLQFFEQKESSHCFSNSKKQKRRKSKDEKLELGLAGKDVPLVLFRAIGKILYCKRNPPVEGNEVFSPEFQSSSKYRDPLTIQPEEVQDHCCLSGRAFSLFLHHNFVPFFENIEDISPALDCFCLSDVIGNSTAYDLSSGSANISDLYEGAIAARSVVYHNSQRATSKSCSEVVNKWRPLHKPSWYQVSQKHKENEIHARSTFWGMNVRSRELILTLLPYISTITTLERNSKNDRLKLSSTLTASQRQVLQNIVHIPKWKSYTKDDGLNDTEVACEFNESVDEGQTVTMDTEDINEEKDEEEEFEIIDISD